MKKRRLAKLLAGVMAAGLLFTACGSGGNSTAPNSSEGSSDLQEPLEISVAVMTGFTQADSKIQKELEKKYNVKFKLVVLPGWTDGASKINLLMSDDSQRPDVIWWWGMEKEFTQWRDAGLLVDVSPYVAKYPNIRGYYESYSPDSMFFAAENDGKMYRIPGDVSEPGTMITLLRKDWLDNLGLQVPTTLDEYADMLRSFTNDDPDGNGVADTYGLAGAGMEYRSLFPFWQAFKSNPEYFIKKDDGTIVHGSTQPETRQALEYISELYKEGLIDPAIITKNNYDEDFVRGGHGSSYRWVAYVNKEAATVQSFYKNNPGADLISISPVKGPANYTVEEPASAQAWCYFGITKNAKDPERVYKVFDDLTSKEDYLFRFFGTEGENYEMKDGKYKLLTPEDQNTSENIGMGLFSNFVNRKDELNIVNSQETINVFKKSAEFAKPEYDRICYFKDPDRPAWNEYGVELEKMRDEVLWGILSGQKPIEDFDKYVGDFYKAGGKEVEAEATEMMKQQDADYTQWKAAQ